MDITITISNRELNPAVLNFFQHENETVTLNFTLDSYMYGEVDLRNYKAYGVTSQNGFVDMTELEMNYDSTDDKLTLSWEVQEYSLRQEGAITYQIVFKENADDGENTAVFYSYKGIMINRGSVDADNHITANYPTILKQWLDKIEELAGTLEAGIIYIPYGETIPTSERLSGRVYFQFTDTANTQGHFEDHECKELKLNEFNNYLSRNGGQMIGHIYKNTDDSFFMISGGSKGNAGVNGASLVMNGKDKSGVFYLYAGDGTNIATLFGSPSGSFTWNGKNIVRSINNIQADTSGNVTVDVGVTTVNGKKGALTSADTGCLPLTGGTITGNVSMSNNKLSNVNAIELVPSEGSADGGFVDFHYAGSTDDYTSRIIEDSEGKLSVTAPNGVTVNNKNVVRSVNGTVADSAGNVIISTYLPLAGGTLTGTLKSSAAPALQSLNTDSQLILLGGNSTNAGAGAKLTLNGGEHADAGEFTLQAGMPGDSTAVYSQLIGKPDGTLTWDGNPVISQLCTTKATTVSSASSTKPAVVVQNYVNGTNFYRVWSDGWIEQGGTLDVASSYSEVNLTKPFSNAQYIVVVSCGEHQTVVTKKNSNSQIYFDLPNSNTGTVRYYACGY